MSDTIPASCERRNHPAKPVQGDDEDYVEYLTRCGAYWTDNPPAAPEGFELIECDATPRHRPMYAPIDDDFYPGGCPSCAYAAMADAHRGCEHLRHRAWRRWRITHWIVGQLYVSGIARTGGGWTMNSECRWCLTSPPKFGRGRRVYVLWVRVDTWRCLLKGHHLPGDPIAFGYCSKCLPCPTCGSNTAGHEPGCEDA